MDYKLAHDYAVANASEEFGSPIMDRINNKRISSATGKLSYVMNIIKYLVDFFETQNNAVNENQEEFLGIYQHVVLSALDGEEGENGTQGIVETIRRYFWNGEFRRDPEKKIAIGLYLKYSVQYIKDNVQVMDIRQFLEVDPDIQLDPRCFNKEVVFGEIITAIETYSTPIQN